jgi:hypothetical protein
LDCNNDPLFASCLESLNLFFGKRFLLQQSLPKGGNDILVVFAAFSLARARCICADLFRCEVKKAKVDPIPDTALYKLKPLIS